MSTHKKLMFLWRNKKILSEIYHQILTSLPAPLNLEKLYSKVKSSQKGKETTSRVERKTGASQMVVFPQT